MMNLIEISSTHIKIISHAGKFNFEEEIVEAFFLLVLFNFIKLDKT